MVTTLTLRIKKERTWHMAKTDLSVFSVGTKGWGGVTLILSPGVMVSRVNQKQTKDRITGSKRRALQTILWFTRRNRCKYVTLQKH